MLHDQLLMLPRISVFFDDAADTHRRLEQETWRSVLPGLLGKYKAVRSPSSSGKKSAERRKKAKESHQRQLEDSDLAKNPFAMLVD